jgi:GT2 family glycosyltransferase/tetratricopeptide (TPR) repeat protein/2-polyprenyl-3-methyl-5-hydroxy-6-metoxy-1,4-benzoquinol methylase
MDVRRVALIFDHKARPETTGIYCRRALGKLVEVEHFLPGETSRIPRQGFDLYLNVDDGLEYHLPPDLHPCAWWAIDTHLNFTWCRQKARGFDFIFAAQRDGAARLRDEGVASAVWLPLACDPELHCKHDVTKEYDVAFVGNVFPGPREDLLELVRRRFPNTFIGRAYFEEMARTYSAARTVFNRSLKSDINMRVFEALACGSLLVTNDLRGNGQEELFQDGVHLATYRDPEELLDKIAFYLAREEARERVAAAGREEALARHTYAVRMEVLLRAVEGGLAKSSARITDPVPPPGPRDRSYFEHARPELLALIPHSARTVLDIGCGAGRLGEALKARQECEVVGIEMDEVASRSAREHLDRVLVGDVERMELDFRPGSFNVVVCGDVLEHLRDPDRLLRRSRDWLSPAGRLIASIPNVRHHSVVRSLLEGNWTYESAGLLDRDHVRFFTRREIEKLFFRAGFAISELGCVAGPDDDWPDRQTRRGSVRLGRLHLGGLSDAEAEEFHAYQYLVTARPEPTPEYGLTSVVILTHNQLGCTRECVDSIRRLTDEPYEVVFVDNASSDGTVDYLRSLPDAKVIVNSENRGFPAAVNQGIEAARGDQILLLNNDTVVTTGWLWRLLRVLHTDPKFGLVGPCSNSVSGPQQVEVGYDALAGLDGFAWDWGKVHEGVLEETDRLVGFCLLIRRAVVDAIGGLDEQFGLGCFEDDDYCLRAKRAGYRAVIARDAFVHHYGGRTFVGSGVDYASLMRENERLFRAKWAPADRRTESNAVSNEVAGLPCSKPTCKPGSFTVAVAPAGGLLLQRKEVRLSLCMIVRDSAGTLVPCLESIRPWVDEMVIVDTGSSDDTARIVERFGGRLFHFPWCDDFSAARNESLRHARGAWLFWMDSDDTIDAGCGRRLRELVYCDPDASVLGYVVQVHCPGGGEDGVHDVTAVDHVKLIRNRPDLRFEGRIHEQILPAIRRASGEVAWTDLFVVHSGSDQRPEAQERKRQRDLHLLDLELRERPEHPFTLFNLGMTYADGGRYEEAVEFLRRSIAHSAPGESHLRKAYALLLYAQMQLKRHDEASQTCQQGRALFPEDAELRFRQGVLLHDLGCLDEAARAYQDVLENREERHFTSVDSGIKGFKARQNLAVVYTDMGDLAAAEHHWRLIVREVPRYRSGWRGLGDVLLRQGKLGEAREVAEQLVGEAVLKGEGLMLRGRVAAARGDHEQAERVFAEAVALRPDDVEVRNALCQFLFEHGRPGDAEQALLDLLRVDPQNASAEHNLGVLYLRARRYGDAVAAFQQSLRHRPDAAGTYLHLGYALKESGRVREAVGAWEQVLRLSPGDSAATEELNRVRGKRVLV